ncbi:GNAT family N-acetyltransferase [Candidatus Berkiella cookevillensis]|uniref:GNAT family N-acetyltransferase n=1 Tax=Candidatus Berkiella cookevillensis TaxID=437022 RepID=A0A0Q9Y9L2_9GAMM|nr:GNAT family N-acetyltransferase [Candidatus Berkiella cookevillensis]MCS5708794.1 GNAT family N-acetyltransferase [Candidatus Berkiella cookevillensis]
MGKISAPKLISEEHELSDFDCGNDVLNIWLKTRALDNQNKFSTTRVVCINKTVIAYYSLVYGSVNRDEMTRSFKQNAPERIPVMILGRLAVDLKWQEKGIGKHLLKEALIKTMEASRIAAVRGLLVHAIDDKAKAYYQGYGFLENKIELTLFLGSTPIRGAL